MDLLFFDKKITISGAFSRLLKGNNMESWVLIPILITVVIVLFMVWAIKRARRIQLLALEYEMRFIERARQIRPDMTKEEVINILGNQYTLSYLQDGVENLVWQYRKYNRVCVDDVWINQLAYTRKISVSFKNDIAIEVRSFDMA